MGQTVPFTKVEGPNPKKNHSSNPCTMQGFFFPEEGNPQKATSGGGLHFDPCIYRGPSFINGKEQRIHHVDLFDHSQS